MLLAASEDWAVRTMLLVWCSLAVLAPFRLDAPLLEPLVALATDRLCVAGKEGKAAGLFLAAVLKRPESGGRRAQLLGWAAQHAAQPGVLGFLCAWLKDGPDATGHEAQIAAVRRAAPPQTRLQLKLLRRLCMVRSALDLTALVQEAVDAHLAALSDRDTVTRWAAAKGLGRLAGLLDADEAGGLFALLLDGHRQAAPEALHGACLAGGQLLGARRAAPPGALAAFVAHCLRFELSKGTHAVGSAVRDAACYVCWAWSRYGPAPDSSAVRVLAARLLCLSLLDREIACRRAGNAAFQELVGRTGAVPQGIELLVRVNFFSVASTRRCFEELLPAALQSAAYRDALVEHLLAVTCRSFDKALRLLAAAALGAAALRPAETAAVEQLALGCAEPVAQHAGLLAASALLRRQAPFPCARLDEALAAFGRAENAARAPGYQLLAEAWLTYVRARAGAGGGPVPAPQLECWLEVVQVALRSRFDVLHTDFCVPALQAIGAAVPAGDPLLTAFYRTKVLPGADKDPDASAQRGFAAAVGAMPTWLLLDRLGPLTNLLCRLAAAAGPAGSVDRRVRIITAMGQLYGRDLPLPEATRDQLFAGLLPLTDDYTMDARGDVGSFVREAALTALCALGARLDAHQARLLLGRLLQQAADRLDRVRGTALRLLGPLGSAAVAEGVLSHAALAGLLPDADLGLPVAKGWVNAAGCATPSVGGPAMAALLPHVGGILPVILGHPDEFFGGRLCRATLLVLQKAHGQLGEHADAVAARVADTCQRRSGPVDLLLEGVRLLKMVPSRHAAAYLEEACRSHPVPRVRQLAAGGAPDAPADADA